MQRRSSMHINAASSFRCATFLCPSPGSINHKAHWAFPWSSSLINDVGLVATDFRVASQHLLALLTVVNAAQISSSFCTHRLQQPDVGRILFAVLDGWLWRLRRGCIAPRSGDALTKR